MKTPCLASSLVRVCILAVLFGSTLLPMRVGAERLGPSSRRTPVAISEIMFHPASGREFVELYNADYSDADLGGFVLEIGGAGVATWSYPLPAGTKIASGQFLVVAPDPVWMSANHGIPLNRLAGGFAGMLPDLQGRVRLLNRQGAILLEVEYDGEAPWPASASGTGHSIVLANPSYGERDPRAWAASANLGGSPGAAEPVTPASAVVLNEIRAIDFGNPDFIELFNGSASPVTLTDCYFSFSAANLRQVAIPSTTLAAGERRAFINGAGITFDVPSSGRVFLSQGNGAGGVTRVLDAVMFGPQLVGGAFGRSPDGARQWDPLSTPTPGAANASVLRQIFINEIMYNPISGDSGDEYVELYNSGALVQLNGYRLAGGVEYTFQTPASIPANGYIIVAKNPARLLARYPGALTAANTFGPYTGELSNRGERLRLLNGGGALVNQVTYADGGRWGRWSDGGGSSLELVDLRADNRLGPNWKDSDESARTVMTTFSKNGTLTQADNWPAESDRSALEIILLGDGECLIDNVTVTYNNANQVANGDFDAASDLNTWNAGGNHARSWDNASGTLRIAATGRGDYVANRVWTPMNSHYAINQNVTISADVRWLRGHPELVFRLRGNGLEMAVTMPTPLTPGIPIPGAAAQPPGTPGAANSAFVNNIGPAILSVAHSPVLPAANTPIVVTARVSDADGLQEVRLFPRVDEGATLPEQLMNDTGIDGDAAAGDGIYSTTVAGRPAGTLLAFYIRATDNAVAPLSPLFRRFPENRECLVRFGETTPAGSLPTYRIWMTRATRDKWTADPAVSSLPNPVVFVYSDERAVYEAGAVFNGSDNTAVLYDSPVGRTSGYELDFPADDRFMGATGALLDWPFRDATAQSEQLSYWMAEQMGIPALRRRYIHLIVNGTHQSTRVNADGGTSGFARVYEDSQEPNGDFIEQWYPDDPDGEAFKIQVRRKAWRFDNSSGVQPSSAALHAQLVRFLDSAQAFNVPSYRWTWRKRAAAVGANDYSSLSALVNAVDSATFLPTPAYVAAVESLMDSEQWMRMFAFERAIGNGDTYGWINGQNMFAYKPSNGRWNLIPYDNDIIMGAIGYSDTSISTGIEDPAARKMVNWTAAFQRAFWRGLREMADGPMVPANYNSMIQQRYQVLNQAGIVGLTTFDTRRNWLVGANGNAGRRQEMIVALNATAAAFTVNTPTSVGNIVTLSGAAPIEVQTIRVNGVAYLVSWSFQTPGTPPSTLPSKPILWSLNLPVAQQNTSLAIQAFDGREQQVGSTLNTSVTLGAAPDPAPGFVVINELHYNPPAAAGAAEFIELFNRSTTTTFDLSGWRFDGVDFTFPDHTLLPPGGFLLVIDDDEDFASAFPGAGPIAGNYGGGLSNDGEILRLIRPGTPDTVIDVVAFGDGTDGPDDPWPNAADGTGPSLQLIDAAEDNNRVGNWAAAGAAPLATPGVANSVAADLPAFFTLYINEWMPNETAGNADWFEIYNPGPAAVTLDGLRLSDDTTVVTIPNNLGAGATPLQIQPNNYLRVLTDLQAGTPATLDANGLHVSFGLGNGGDTIAILNAAGTIVIDSIMYGNFVGMAGQSQGRIPDGGSSIFFLNPATRAAANRYTPVQVPVSALRQSGQVQLQWTAAIDITDYQVQRALVPAGPFTTLDTITATTFTDTTVNDATLYYYQVVARRTVGAITDSSTSVAILVPAQLPAPGGLAAAAGDQRALLSWNAVAGAVSYTLKRGLSAAGPFTTVAAGITTLGYLEQGLANGVPYHYVVAAFAGDNVVGVEGARSASVSVTPNGPLATPSRLAATVGNGFVTLTWNAIPGQTYQVRRAASAAGPFANVGGQVTGGAFTDNTVVNFTQYYYIVVAIAGGTESVPTLPVPAKPGAVPAAPQNLVATPSSGSITLNWSASAGASSYVVKRSLTSGGAPTHTVEVTATTRLDSGLQNGQTYYYVVSAKNEFGEGPNSAEVSATPQTPAGPTGLAATLNGATVTLTWNSYAGATSYRVKRGSSPGGQFQVRGSPTQTTFQEGGIVANTDYYYVVSAITAQGETLNSAPVLVRRTPATARFLRTDATTKGNWHGVYGVQGYHVVGAAPQVLPPLTTLSLSDHATSVWDPNPAAVRALQTPTDPNARIAARWHSAQLDNFTIHLNLGDGRPHQVALYCLEWENFLPMQTIEILDAGTDAVLDTRTVTRYDEGKYLIWQLSGRVKIKVTDRAFVGVAVSGLFIDPLEGAGAMFVGTDETTKGNWPNAYGTAGARVVGDTLVSLPPHASLDPIGNNMSTWADGVGDARALRKLSNPNTRIAACWHSWDTTAFTLDLNLRDGLTYQVAFYCLDWDQLGRSQTIEILDAECGRLLDRRAVSGFEGGRYFIWKLRGHVHVRFTDVSSINAVVSGVFFDPASLASATYLAADTTTQGNWQGAYGSSGYQVVGSEPHRLPSRTTLSVFDHFTSVWNPNVADSVTRALQQPANPSSRIAGCWHSWDFTEFSMDLDLGSEPQRMALYFLDWDGLNRNQTVEISDANSGTVLDTRTVTQFANSRYLIWRLSGRVRVRIVQNTGINAVLSGVFFDPDPIARFVKIEEAPQGDWIGAYGGEGYQLAGVNPPFLPPHATLGFEGNLTSVWAPDAGNDVRVLLDPLNAGQRLAACWHSWDFNHFYLDLRLGDGLEHQVALYCLDFDDLGRVQQFEITDVRTGQLLDSRVLSDFANGRYVVWNLSGHVRIKVTDLANVNAVVSGFFIEPIGNRTGATFLGVDETTQGDWYGIYGGAGLRVAGDFPDFNPPSAQITFEDNNTSVWANSVPEDVRALRKVQDPFDRIAACWHSWETEQFTIDLDLGDGRNYTIALYCLDWDQLGRIQTIEIIDPTCNRVLDAREVSEFQSGKYLKWNLRGHVRIRCSDVPFINSVISGMFFDASP